jgi:transposase
MEHVAIDLGGRESQVCVRGADGTLVEERRCRTDELGMYLAKRAPSRVVLETCAEAFRVTDLAKAAGHEVRVVPSMLVRSLGVGARGVKNDRKDAQVLSEVSTRIELPSVHVPSPQSRTQRAQSTAREALISARTQLINSSRGWARTEGVRVRSGATETFPRRLRAAAGAQLPVYIESMLVVIEALNGQIAEADRALTKLAKESPTCRLLMTMPGVGPVTAVRFMAAVDEVSRFETSSKLEAYLGLVPGEHSSSDRQRRTGITKAGPPPVRRTLLQAAWCVYTRKPFEPMVQWATEIERRRGKHIAVVALARKMAGVLFAMWKHHRAYDPKRSVNQALLAISASV